MITNVRHQNAVGQGFFHSGSLGPCARCSPWVPSITYVYDCGAMNAYSQARTREIQSVRQNTPQLDLLFLSHIHADHVNGLRDLLEGLTVDTIVMPLLTVVERLLAVTASISDGASVSGLHVDLAVDPTAAVEQFNPRQILYIKRTGEERDSGAPNDGDAPTHDGPTGPDGDISWKLVGRGTVTPGNAEAGSEGESPLDARSFTVEDVNALAGTIAGQRLWLFAPYVQPGAINEAQFIDILATALSQTPAELQRNLRTVAFRRMLITTHVKSLKAAYEAASKDLNFTSLSLYSGPVRRSNVVPTVHPGHYEMSAYGWLNVGTYEPSPYGWLGTGDADLLTTKRLTDFVHHYHGLFDEVGTLTVPHHGSDQNSASPLYESVKPRVCISAADAYRAWRHPASSVTQAIASAGTASIVVTSSMPSRFRELCILAH
jgi:hypothetical protein